MRHRTTLYKRLTGFALFWTSGRKTRSPKCRTGLCDIIPARHFAYTDTLCEMLKNAITNK